MTTSSSHVVQVEYCRSCETHSWCTHHEEAKYHDTFLKLSQLIAERHPHLEVIGNMVPSHLIPFKIAQNKYIDAHTHKYVLYPQIGSFEVLLDGNVIFSKKEQNAWPNLNNIINKISIALDPNFVCPPQQSSCSPRQKESKSPRKEKLVATPVKKKPNDIHKSHDQKKTTHKEPIKGFTLTDHFKLYKSKHNHNDKDWQTEKHESETSSKQLSEFGRTQSREKSEGESTKVILRDLSGETKLKEMLRSRGVLVKDQGRKQMIIKLDSIEEENAYEDNNVTQRTTDKHHKTTKIQELEDAFSSLQNKFINFQTKVQDIHTRKEEFELKGGHDYYDKKKINLRREESLKQQEKILPSFQRPYNDRPSKLEQYLSASEQQKNQKLHRIYGEWKLLKQTAKKNKRMLKNKKSPQRQEQGESDEETSLSNSHSSANIIAFRPKKSQNPMQEHIQSVLKKGHKKSTIESYQASSSGIPSSSQPRFRTEQHFYQGHLKKQKLNDDRQEQRMPVARLFKNSTNTMSVEEMRTALRQSNPKLMKQQQTEVSKFSHNAKQSITKIQAKMNQLQHQLSKHKENKIPSPSYPQQHQQQNHVPANVGRAQSKRSMSHSSASSSSSSSYQQFNRYQPLKKGQSPHKHLRQGSHQKNQKIGSQQKYRPQRNSYTGKVQQIQKATSKKINNSRFTNNSESTRKNYAYHQGPGSFAIEEESEPRESNLNTQRSNHRHEPTASHVSSRTTQNPNRKHPPMPPKGKKNLLDLNNHTGELFDHRQQREDLEQSRQYHGQSRELHRQSREHHGSSKQYHEQSRKNHRQKSSRLNKYELHEPVTFLRKQKDWKQSELHNQSKSQRHSRIVEQEAQKNINPNRSNVSQSSRNHPNRSNVSKSSRNHPNRSNVSQFSRNKVKPSVSKFSQYSSRSKKINTFKQKSSKSSKKQQEPRQLGSKVVQGQKRAYGRIKKNNKKSSQHSKPEDYYQETTKNEGYQNYQKQMCSDEQMPRTHTGRIVGHQGNKRILRYYRSQDICYEGKSSRPVYVDGSSGEQAEKQGVQGWAMQSEDENSECPFNESGQERYQEENECQENNLDSQSNRRNSLDKQLDHIEGSRHNDQTVVPLASGDASSGDGKIDNKSQSTKDKVVTEGKNSEGKNNDEKMSKMNKVKKTKKTNKQKKAKINNKEKKLTKRQNEDLDKIVSKQYSQFLLAKIVYELTKPQKTKQCPALENNQYENQQITVQVNYCQSIESIEGSVEQVPTNFLSFKPTQLNQEENAEQIQQSEKEEDQEESAEESDQEHESEEQNEKEKKEEKDENAIGFAGAVVPLSSENNKTTTSQKVEKTSSVLNSKVEQSDNVYSQAKEPNKFKEVGIQKEAPVQISVQTEEVIEGRVMTAKNNSIFTPRSPSNHQSITNKTHPNFYKQMSQKQIERADIIPKIYSNDIDTEISKFTTVIEGNFDFIHKEDGNVAKADQIYPQGCLMKEKTLELDLIATRFTNLLKAVDILCEKSEWLVTRLFQDKQGILSNKSFGVWLCKDHRWECFVLDNTFQVNGQNQLLYSQHQGNQMWFNVLEKGFALALGGYEQLQKADSSFLFSMLTGCNSISSKIKEDPTKSGKLLQLITDSLRKNYIIHATKNHIKEKNDRESLFYINSIRKAGQETLIEMSQDGLESFWVKLTKFVQQFSKVDILQLRINYHFTHLDLGVPRPEQLKVIQLDFQEEGQGCVTLSSPGSCGSLRVFLYRQEKSKVLKLVGQAKEKNKSSLFFECNFTEGKYYVFTQGQQSALRLSFAGQTQPVITITEQINSEGLKNDMAEYLPVNDKEDKFRRTQQEWGVRSSKARLRDNFFESRLRQTFVDYIIGRGKRQ